MPRPQAGALQPWDDPHCSPRQGEVAQTEDFWVSPVGTVKAEGPRLVGEAREVSAHTQGRQTAAVRGVRVVGRTKLEETQRPGRKAEQELVGETKEAQLGT